MYISTTIPRAISKQLLKSMVDGGGMDWEFGISKWKLSNTYKWITLLYQKWIKHSKSTILQENDFFN